jgi:hypothetical protein
MPTADSYARLAGAPAARPSTTFSGIGSQGANTYVSSPASTGSRAPVSNTPSYTTPQGPSYSIGGGDYGSYGGSSYAIAAPPPPPNKDEWIASDAGYKAQRDALIKALADYQTNYDAEIKQYDVGYEKGIKQLGWDYTKLDDPMTEENEGVGAWNTTDMTRSSGRSYQNQLNDFASRNLLQSTLYAQAVADLMRSLDEQLGNINMERSNFRNDKSRALTAYKTDNESQKNLAYADAASRYSALFGV